MSAIVCPGIHDLKLTESFLEELLRENCNLSESVLIFPAQDYPAYSAFHILQFLRERQSLASPLVFISFSAGVVGAIGAAWGWQMMSGKVKAFIALDGWGVPLSGNFPIHRVSHDYFTHWSSAILGTGEDNFYASPGVEHLELWRSPSTATGFWVHSQQGKSEQKTSTTAAEFLTMLLERYGELGIGDR